jgi:1,4-alpha-glucan branching enzyme
MIAVLLASFSLSGCFGGSKGGGPATGPEIADDGVIFRYFDQNARRVTLVGDFNNWSPTADPMVDENGDGEWTLVYNLPPGVYEYKFVVDGTEWVPDPRNPEKVSDGFNGENSVVRVRAR